MKNRQTAAAMILAFGAVALSEFVAILGIELGSTCMKRAEGVSPHPTFDDDILISGGRWYASIIERGYYIEPDEKCNVAFFPVYPALAAAVNKISGLGVVSSLLFTSHACLLGALIVGSLYFAAHPQLDREQATWALLWLALCPATCFGHLAYSESTFLFVVLLFLFGIQQSWPPWVVASVYGLATGVRPTGVALLPPLLVWLRTRTGYRAFGPRWMGALVLGTSGLALYCVYLAARLGSPFAFVHAQQAWAMRPPTSLATKLIDLATLKPFWATYLPCEPCYWRTVSRDPLDPLLSLQFANPIYFLGAVLLIGLGWKRGWISRPELLLGAGLLAMPYLLRAHEMCMSGHARFAAVVAPVYIVGAKLTSSLPAVVRAGLAAVFAIWLFIYCALGVAGYSLI